MAPGSLLDAPRRYWDLCQTMLDSLLDCRVIKFPTVVARDASRNIHCSKVGHHGQRNDHWFVESPLSWVSKVESLLGSRADMYPMSREDVIVLNRVGGPACVRVELSGTYIGG